MIIVERQSNGTTIIRIHKDWHPGRIGLAYVPPIRNHVQSKDACRIQRALIGRGVR